MTNEFVKGKLTEKFGDQLTEWNEPYGFLTFTAPKDLNLKIMTWLFDEPTLNFRFLTDLTAVHYPDRTGEEIAVVYHLHSLLYHPRC